MNALEKAEILISKGFASIPSFDGYWCNGDGEIASVVNPSKSYPKILSPLIINTGYKTVYLRVCGCKPKRVTVHRLVALTFIPNPMGFRCIDHLDSNRLNNCVSNLEWVTHKENTRRMLLSSNYVAPKGEQCTKALLSEAQAREIYQRMVEGESTSLLCSEYNVSSSTVIGILNGDGWKHLRLKPVFRGIPKGGKSPHSKLTDNQVAEIREMIANKFKDPDIAKAFNVSISCIQHIKHGRSRKI
jgi:transposase